MSGEAKGYWRSPSGENHGTDSKPGDFWVELVGPKLERFDMRPGSTTYTVEIHRLINSGAQAPRALVLDVYEGGDLLFGGMPLPANWNQDTVWLAIKSFYYGREDGEGRGRFLLQHQLRDLLGVAAK